MLVCRAELYTDVVPLLLLEPLHLQFLDCPQPQASLCWDSRRGSQRQKKRMIMCLTCTISGSLTYAFEKSLLLYPFVLGGNLAYNVY